ncbi:MAG: electron transfer flavoprotein beta subunit/FixA family protein [Actinobacteria bacterium]|nr:electron transfer flavoprotein beta subunit/FixA family protein [Actinomycetota bacterium]MCG2802650.1 hypothetical protein [Cellulomonas sp.]
MKIVIAYKWAANPQDADVAADGRIDWSRAKSGFGEYDAVAAEVARRLVDVAGGEVIGLSVGGPEIASGLARKGALSRGLDRLVIVADPSLDHADPVTTARVLAAAVEQIGDVDLVLTGDASVDVAGKIVPALLAARLGWPTLADCGQPTVTGAALTVDRATAGGRQQITVQLPAVLSTAPDAVVPRVPGMKDILAAAKRPVQELAVADLAIAPATLPVSAAVSRPQLPSRRRHMIDATDPAAAARSLVAELTAAGTL